jgi:peptide/nickel transport system substrate-binding protein
MIPWLATSWKVYNETAWEVNIRKGVKFHCGHPLTADDVINTFEVLKNPNFTTNKWSLGRLRLFEKVDEYTVRISAVDTLGKPMPFAVLPYYLACGPNQIFCKDCFEKYGFDALGTTYACGTGPYRLKEFRAGEIVVLEKNKDYWKGPVKGPDIIEVVRIKDDAARITALETGEVCWINMVPPVEINRLREKGFNVTSVPNNRCVWIFINVMKSPCDDVRIRQAMNYAVNVPEICEKILYGATVPIHSVCHPTLPGYYADTKFKYDPAKARELLTEAGYKGEEIVLWTMWGRYTMDKQVAETIADYWRAVGINVKVVPMEYGTFLSSVKSEAVASNRDGSKASYHALFAAWASTTGENWYQLYGTFHSSVYPRYFENYCFYDEIDSLLDTAAREFDVTKRNQIFIEIQKKISDEALVVYLYGEPTVYAQTPNLKGVWYKADEMFSFVNATITSAKSLGSIGSSMYTPTVLPLLGYSVFLLSEARRVSAPLRTQYHGTCTC